MDSLIAIIWNEGVGAADQTPALILSPDLHRHRTATTYDHYSMLATVEDRLRVPRLGHATTADALTGVLGAA